MDVTLDFVDAIISGNYDRVREFLETGVDANFVDGNGFTPLHWACSRQQPKCAVVLISHGAQVHAKDNLHWTPMHHAAANNSLRCIEVLLVNGADVFAKNSKGKTPAQLAKTKEMVQLLKNYRKYQLLKEKDEELSLKPKQDLIDAFQNNDQEKITELKRAIERRRERLREKARDYDERERQIAEQERVLEEQLTVVREGRDRLKVAAGEWKKKEAHIVAREENKKNLEGQLREDQLDTVVRHIKFSDLDLGEVIGEGAYASVYKAMWGGVKVACKMIKCPESPDEQLIESFNRECFLLSTMRHANIVLLMAIVNDPPNLCMVTELLEGGDLFNLLHSSVEISWDERVRLALDIARGVNYLHSMSPPLVHRDLKSKNILIDRTGRAKVTDFGTTRMKERSIVETKSQVGTPAWMPPECLRGEDFNEKCDVYGFGVIMWELLMRQTPWEGKPPLEVISSVGFNNVKLPVPPVPPSGCSEAYLALMEECWLEAYERPSFPEIMDVLTAILSQDEESEFEYQDEGSDIDSFSN